MHEGVAVIEAEITGIALTVIVLEAVKLQVVVVVVINSISSMAKSFPPEFMFLLYNTILALLLVSEFQA